jgi:hypothetical protein
LKKKEELEARLRLRAVSNGGPSTSDKYGREERHKKRRRLSDDEDYDRDRRRKRRSRERLEDDFGRLTRSDTEDERRHTHRGSRSRNHDAKDEGRNIRRHYEEKHRSNHRERRPGRVHDLKEDEDKGNRRRRKRRLRSSSGDSSTSSEQNHHRHRRKERRHRPHRERLSSHSDDARNPGGDKESGRPRSSPTNIDATSSIARKNETSPVAAPDSDSDPLEALVGPLPPSGKSTSVNDPSPLRSRGRGAYKPSASAMDQHFSSNYNPSLDLHPDSEQEGEKDDWDMALEALRDRELWKQKGAERLRAAGFGDEEIKKWEDSGKEKGVEDVKWTGKGEAREWDRGKVVEEVGIPAERKGEVGLEAAWKRKGGGFLKDFKKALG